MSFSGNSDPHYTGGELLGEGLKAGEVLWRKFLVLLQSPCQGTDNLFPNMSFSKSPKEPLPPYTKNGAETSSAKEALEAEGCFFWRKIMFVEKVSLFYGLLEPCFPSWCGLAKWRLVGTVFRIS